MDIATLGLAVDARPAATAADTLDGLTAASGRAEGATQRLTATQRAFGQQSAGAFEAAKRTTGAVEMLRAKADEAARATQRMGAAQAAAVGQSKALQQATLNMTRQFADVGVQLGSGQSPFLILLQQGPQIADGFQVAAQQGLGFRAVMAGLFAQLRPVLAVLAPIGVAAAGFGAAFALAARSVNQDTKGLVADLNLTEDQMKSLKDSGETTAITLTDAFLSFGSTVKDVLAEAFGPQIESAQSAWNSWLDDLTTNTGKEVATILGLFIGAYNDLTSVWALLPAALGDAAVQAANAVITALNFMLQKSAEGINALRESYNSLPAWARGNQAGPTMTAPQFDTMQNQYAGGLSAAFSTSRESYAAGAEQATAMVDGFNARWRRNMRATATDRLKDAAGDPNKARDAGKSDADREYERLVKASEAFVKGLTRETAEIGLNNIAKKQLAISAAVAVAPTNELAWAIIAAGGAWIQATDAFENSQAIEKGVTTLSDMVQGLERQAMLTGQSTNAQALMNAEWAIADLQLKNITPKTQELIDRILQLAQSNEIAARATTALLDELALVDDLARDAGRGIADAFGDAGRALADMTSALTSYGLERQRIADEQREGRLTEAQAARAQANVEVRTYGDMASAAKGFFGEKTAAYKILQGVEMAYRAVQFAGAVQAMALDTAETGSSIGNAIARGAAYAAEAVSKIFAQLGPWGFPVAAAALGVIAAVGGKVMGGGGAGAMPTLPSTNTGTGTVSGNQGAQSDSLAKSLDQAERYQNRDLEFSSRSLNALRAIQANIGSLTNAIAREMNVGGALDPTGLTQGPTTSGGFLGAFSTTRSSELVGSGINLSGGALSDLIARGVSGGLYQIVQTTSRNSGFFGIGASTRTTNNETSTPIDQRLSQEFSRVLGSLREGVLSAAGDLGLTGAEAVLDAFQVNLGRISFEGMSSSEISTTLNAVFSAVGDDMARAILPSLDAFQRAGEGMLETLSRLATEYRTVDVTLQSLGMTFGAVGLASVEARSRLVELSGGLDAFTEGASFFAENFLTDAQRIAPVQAAVSAELTRLGIAANIGRSQFADLVMGLDVSTASGADMFAALMRLAPAIDQTLAYTEELTGAVTDLGTAVDNTADIARQRRSLEIALMEAQGNAAGALAARRQDEVEALFAVNRPLQLAIYAALDLAAANEALARQQTEAAAALAQVQQEAAQAVDQARSDLSAAYEREASAITATRDRFQAFADTLANFRRGLDIDDGLNGVSYAAARAQAMQFGARAALGDEEALGGLTGTISTYLEASRGQAATQLDYLRDLSAAKILLQRAEGTATRTATNAQRQLVELERSVEGLLTVNNSVLSVRDAITRLQIALTAQSALGPAAGAGASAMPTWAANTAPGQDFGANPGFNMRLASLTGYSGSFAGSGFESWISAQSDALRQVARSAYRDFDMVPGFATGGSFTVGGSGGPDSQYIPLALTPGEMVNVRRGDQSDATADEVRALRAEVAMLRTAMEQVAVNTGRTARASEGQADDIDRIVNGETPIITIAA